MKFIKENSWYISYLCCVTKCLTGYNVIEKELLLAYSWKVYSPLHQGKVWQQNYERSGHISRKSGSSVPSLKPEDMLQWPTSSLKISFASKIPQPSKAVSLPGDQVSKHMRLGTFCIETTTIETY